MDDIEKLKKLIPHWMEHNDEHAESYKIWAERVSSCEMKDLSEILLKLHSESKKLKTLFEEAIKILNIN